MRLQIRRTMLAQRIGQGGHCGDRWECAEGVKCLQFGQARQQIQRVEFFGWVKLRTDQVQIAPGGADMAVAQQFLDGEQVNPAFQKMGGKAVAPIPMSE